MVKAEKRFWSKVDTSGECWLWTAAQNPRGYGMFNVGGKMGLAHRFAYELLVGPIPPGMLLDHRTICPKCCVNPAHLRLVDHKQNAENRAAAQGVPRGVCWHPLTNKWMARVTHNYKSHYVGVFDTLEEAAEAARLKRIELFTHNDLDRTGA